MNNIQKVYPAKILLFGEHTVLQGGKALAIPFWKYNGKWVRGEQVDSMEEFLAYLMSFPWLDFQSILEVATPRTTFSSSIPYGYGLGSSGALTAAIYDTYGREKDISLVELKQRLGLIESFFHGESSGLDPLTSYLNQPILVSQQGTEALDKIALPPQIKLYNSKISRSSKPLIDYYKDRYHSEEDFKEEMDILSLYNDKAISGLLEQEDIRTFFKEISILQYTHLQAMIPPAVAKIWQAGLIADSYYMKLSGAGGGGYFLVWDDASHKVDSTRQGLAVFESFE